VYDEAGQYSAGLEVVAAIAEAVVEAVIDLEPSSFLGGVITSEMRLVSRK
jgi:hypothetical protein